MEPETEVECPWALRGNAQVIAATRLAEVMLERRAVGVCLRYKRVSQREDLMDEVAGDPAVEHLFVVSKRDQQEQVVVAVLLQGTEQLRGEPEGRGGRDAARKQVGQWK